MITIGNFSYMLVAAVKRYFITVDGVIVHDLMVDDVMEYNLIGGRL